MQVSGQLQAQAILAKGKVSQLPTESEAPWAPEPVWTVWRWEYPLYLLEIKPWYLRCPAYSVSSLCQPHKFKQLYENGS